MITSQIIQTSIDELKAITKVDLGVYDLNGSEVASTMERDDITTDLITGFATSPADSQVIGVHHLLKIRDEGELLYVLVARGMTDDVYMVGKIAVSQIQNLVIAYKERFDRNNFFQNLLLDNLLLVDIYNRAKKLHVEVTCPRAVYLIETKDEKDGIVSEVLKSMFSPQSGDYVTAVDESSLILIKSVENTTTPQALHELAETIVAMMNAEALLDVKVAYGTVVQELKDVSKSYKEAKMALDVGKIFYAEKKVIAYSTLGIGRLIYQLPVNLCKIFIGKLSLICSNCYLLISCTKQIDFINIFHRDLGSLFQDQQLLRLVHSFYMPRGCHICTAILFFIGDEEGHRNFRVNLFFFQYQPYFVIQLLFFIFIQLDPLFRNTFRLF